VPTDLPEPNQPNYQKSIERAVATLDLSTIKFEGSDSLDDPNKVMEDNKSAGAVPASSPQ